MAVILHTADLHIDRPAERARASRRAVVRLVDFALATRADLLLIAGDVFDRAADSAAAGRFFAGELGRLGEAGVTVLVAAGNHDAACPLATSHSRALSYSRVPSYRGPSYSRAPSYRGPSYSRGPAYSHEVRWFPTGEPGSVVLAGLGVAVHGQGLADPTEPRDLGARFPAPIPGYLNIGVLHTSLDGASSRTTCAPTSVERLASKGYDYWALGHVHRRRVLASDPWIAYPGSLADTAGVTVVRSVGGAIASVTHHDLAIPPARVRTPA